MSSDDLKKEALAAEVAEEEKEDEVKVEMPETREVDIHNRDPLDINSHIKVGINI